MPKQKKTAQGQPSFFQTSERFPNTLYDQLPEACLILEWVSAVETPQLAAGLFIGPVAVLSIE